MGRLTKAQVDMQKQAEQPNIDPMLKEFQDWMSYYGYDSAPTQEAKASAMKGAIGKYLRESIGDDGNTHLTDHGYDHVIISNAPVGITETTIINNEVIVLPEYADKVRIVDYDTGIYHFSEASFDKFDVDMIGSSHGDTYGAGIYLTDTDIPGYGKRMNVDISTLNKPYRLDLTDINNVCEYLWLCIEKPSIEQTQIKNMISFEPDMGI